MKRFFSLLLCLVLLLLCFSGCANNKETTQLLVGYGRVDITPDFSVPIGGYPNPENRWSSNVLDPLYATAIAFTDNDNNTAILMTFDLGNVNNQGIGFAMKDIEEELGVPRTNIFMSGTHTHSGPHNGTFTGYEHVAEAWSDLLREKTLEAAKLAMESRLPAEIYATSIETYNLNFVRHYLMDDGSLVGDNFGNPTDKQFVRHTQDADTDLQLLRFKREGGKDVVLANYQSHPLRAGGSTDPNLTSDFIGPMGRYVEANMDCHFAYFTGASANIDPYSQIHSENITGNYLDQGEALGEYVVLACSNMQKLDSGNVQILKDTCTVDNVRGGTATTDIKLGAFSVGDVGFVNAPYEMFCSNGKYVKDNSPFSMTFVTTLAYNSSYYIPDAKTFAYDVDSYEETQCPYAAGTGEKLAEAFVAMLDQLYSTKK